MPSHEGPLSQKIYSLFSSIRLLKLIMNLESYFMSQLVLGKKNTSAISKKNKIEKKVKYAIYRDVFTLHCLIAT